MKPVTRFQADDGSIHDTPEAASSTDLLNLALVEAMAIIPAPTTDQDEAMSGGKAYLQHQPKDVVEARRRVLDIVAREMPYWASEKPKLFDATIEASHNFIGRIIDDTGGPLNVAWHRISRIDSLGREWEQPYFVYNTPAEARAV